MDFYIKKINDYLEETYDHVLANCHLANWGKIYVDPCTNEPYEVEDVLRNII